LRILRRRVSRNRRRCRHGAERIDARRSALLFSARIAGRIAPRCFQVLKYSTAEPDCGPRMMPQAWMTGSFFSTEAAAEAAASYFATSAATSF